MKTSRDIESTIRRRSAAGHPAGALEQAAATAKRRGVWRLKDLRRLLTTNDNVFQVDFLEVHLLLRPLEAYTSAPSAR